MIDPGIQGALLRVASPCARNTQQWGDCTQQPAQQPAPLPSLKALAVAALTRNNPRNNDATSPENPRNNGPILEAGLLRDIRDRLHRLADAEGIDPGLVGGERVGDLRLLRCAIAVVWLRLRHRLGRRLGAPHGILPAVGRGAGGGLWGSIGIFSQCPRFRLRPAVCDNMMRHPAQSRDGPIRLVRPAFERGHDRAAQSGASVRTQRMADKVARESPELARLAIARIAQ